jgi:hypothetical protein
VVEEESLTTYVVVGECYKQQAGRVNALPVQRTLVPSRELSDATSPDCVCTTARTVVQLPEHVEAGLQPLFNSSLLSVFRRAQESEQLHLLVGRLTVALNSGAPDVGWA